LYILTIGGDFMSGRFFSAPLIISVAIISLEIKSRKNQLVLIFVVLLLGCFSFRSPLIASNANLYYSNFPVFDGNGIADERLFYINPNRNKGFVENGFLNPGYYSKFAGEKWYFVGFKKVVVADLLGETGYMKGPNFYLTDHYALSDPLLARLPIQNKNWRIGHFYRDFPEGYLDTLGTNENMIVDPELALYYSKLKTIISGPILDWQRVIEIWKFNTGQYDYLMESYLSRIKN
jgi:arabinofuranosyltransferase